MSAVLSNILPITGCISYDTFSLKILVPKEFALYLGPDNTWIAGALWFTAHLGVGQYLYTREHIKYLSLPRRALYTVFGTFIFNFGSVLLWSVCKRLLPKSPFVRIMFGLLSGCGLLYTGKSYVDFIDENIHCEVDD